MQTVKAIISGRSAKLQGRGVKIPSKPKSERSAVFILHMRKRFKVVMASAALADVEYLPLESEPDKNVAEDLVRQSRCSEVGLTSSRTGKHGAWFGTGVLLISDTIPQA